ncbi:SAV_915 family protein [Streptomyces sp. NPDC001822]|uniref:SAV_915 family protein n=1 Tax=Streptomyces sp. NPDC001822 TaxID=3364614 RepID=UPI0036990B62
MCLISYESEPEPEEPLPAGPLHVPVRPGRGTEAAAVRLFRTPLGTRTAVGFTSAARLAATLGSGQASIRLSEALLRTLCEPLGAHLVTVDPTLSAPAVVTASTPRPVRTPVRTA